MSDAIRATRCPHCERLEHDGSIIRGWGRCTLLYGHDGPHAPETAKAGGEMKPGDGTVTKWIDHAAQQICHDLWLVDYGRQPNEGTYVCSPRAYKKIVESITKCAEPIVALLRESRREHIGETMNCGALDDGPGGYGTRGECTCGADAWNARVDAVLGERT